MPLPLLVTFVAGASGTWRIDRLATVIGDGLPAAERLAVLEGSEAPAPTEAGWGLRGVTSNTRYTNRSLPTHAPLEWVDRALAFC